jgi:hypothetical protein
MARIVGIVVVAAGCLLGAVVAVVVVLIDCEREKEREGLSGCVCVCVRDRVPDGVTDCLLLIVPVLCCTEYM